MTGAFKVRIVQGVGLHIIRWTKSMKPGHQIAYKKCSTAQFQVQNCKQQQSLKMCSIKLKSLCSAFA